MNPEIKRDRLLTRVLTSRHYEEERIRRNKQEEQDRVRAFKYKDEMMIQEGVDALVAIQEEKRSWGGAFKAEPAINRKEARSEFLNQLAERERELGKVT